MGHADRGGTENHYAIDSFLIPFLSKEIYSNTYGGTEIIFESFTIQLEYNTIKDLFLVTPPTDWC